MGLTLCLLGMAAPLRAAPNRDEVLRITKAVLCRRYDAKARTAQEITTVFKPSDRTLRAVVELNRVTTGDQVKCVWIVVDAGGLKNYRVVETTLRTAQMNVLHFSTRLPRDWPRGKYRADIYFNERRTHQLPFIVR